MTCADPRHRGTSATQAADPGPRDAAARLAATFEQAAVGLAHVTPDGNWLRVNPKLCEIVGYSRDELMGLTFQAITHPDDLRADVANVERLLAGEIDSYTMEKRYVRKDGSSVWVNLAVSLVRGADGRPDYFISVIEDISARRRAEAAREQSEATLRAVFDAAAAGIARVGLDGRVLNANRALQQMLGYGEDELLALGYADVTHPDDLSADVDGHQRMLRGGADRQRVRKRYVRKDGSTFWADLTVSLVRDGAGEPLFAVAVVEDVTERWEAERTRADLAAIVESSEDAIVGKTLDGAVTSWNAGAQQLFGYAAEEMIGATVTRLIPEDHRHEEAAILNKVRRGERVAAYETVRVTKDGRRLEVAVTVSPVRDGAGRVVGASKIARDVSERKRAQRELQEAKEAAEAANRAKDQFLAVLSHELRTPLAPVLASVSHLASLPSLPADVRGQLEMVRRNVEMEARLIDDLLDLTRVSRGKLELHHEVTDAHAVLSNAMEIVRAAAEAKGVEVSLQPEARQHHVWADPARVQQVLWNLLTNAVKFTPAGGRVVLRTANDAEDTSNASNGSNTDGKLVITVTDTGIGICPDVLPRLFNAFEQGERQVTRAFGGLGLGLTISRALAEMHHGTLTAASAGRGQGATFTLTLGTVPVPATSSSTAPSATRRATSNPTPTTAADNAGAADPADTGPTGSNGSNGSTANANPSLQILLVEDHIDTRAVMCRVLRSLGHRVTPAGSVGEATDLAAREPFDVLICDLGLPDGSGLDVIREVRAKRPIRGIALTGYGMDEDVRRTREAGFDTHLTKPVDLPALEKSLRRP